MMLLLTVFAVSLPAGHAQERSKPQNEARAHMVAGKVKSLRSIENRFKPSMEKRGFQYLGPEFDARSLIYRLKFIRDGRVVRVDVDGRTGSVLRKGR